MEEVESAVESRVEEEKKNKNKNKRKRRGKSHFLLGCRARSSERAKIPPLCSLDEQAVIDVK